jgi:hypothetical protein
MAIIPSGSEFYGAVHHAVFRAAAAMRSQADGGVAQSLRHIGSICRQLSDFSILTGPTLAGLINS